MTAGAGGGLGPCRALAQLRTKASKSGMRLVGTSGWAGRRHRDGVVPPAVSMHAQRAVLCARAVASRRWRLAGGPFGRVRRCLRRASCAVCNILVNDCPAIRCRGVGRTHLGVILGQHQSMRLTAASTAGRAPPGGTNSPTHVSVMSTASTRQCRSRPQYIICSLSYPSPAFRRRPARPPDWCRAIRPQPWCPARRGEKRWTGSDQADLSPSRKPICGG